MASWQQNLPTRPFRSKTTALQFLEHGTAVVSLYLDYPILQRPAGAAKPFQLTGKFLYP
jgi:hypothetical protein